MSCHKSIQKARARAFQHQEGRCCYCCQPMWLGDLAAFCNKYGFTLSQAKTLRCTAEHLLPRCDGGRNVASNIVAACLHCNSTRHKRRVPPDPATFRAQVRKRVAQGRWHPPHVLKAIQSAFARRT
jgi:hypothetical protein